MSKVIRELSDEEVWRLGLDDFPYVEDEFENINKWRIGITKWRY